MLMPRRVYLAHGSQRGRQSPRIFSPRASLSLKYVQRWAWAATDARARWFMHSAAYSNTIKPAVVSRKNIVRGRAARGGHGWIADAWARRGRLSSFKLGLARSDTRPPAFAPAPPGPPVGLDSLEVQGHLGPDLSPRGGTAARSFAPDMARIGPRFQQNPPNSFSSAPRGTSGSLNRIKDRKPPRPSDGPDLCGLQSSPRLGQAPKTKNKHKMRLLRCPLPSSR